MSALAMAILVERAQQEYARAREACFAAAAEIDTLPPTEGEAIATLCNRAQYAVVRAADALEVAGEHVDSTDFGAAYGAVGAALMCAWRRRAVWQAERDVEAFVADAALLRALAVLL